MTDFSDERLLAFFLLLNTAVYGSAWFFARRRITSSRSQALLDAALLGYAIQYIAVGLPGMLGFLRPAVACFTAIAISFGLILAAWNGQIAPTIHLPRPERLLITAIGLFTTCFILIFAYTQADLPVLSNDALTYHFPAAMQWLQQGRISIFNAWFFNPANAYSPLAGSTFIVWLMVPFGSDVMARFVEVPALLCVGLAMYRLCQEIGARRGVAALIAGAAVLARPIFLPSMMGKDDLFVAFFFIAILVALSPNQAAQRWGAMRIGVVLGLLLATKYTALLSVPMLVLAMDKQILKRSGFFALIIAGVFAGPWYLRNFFQTGNPLFPLDVSLLGIHLFHGLFTSAPSETFGSFGSATRVLIGGSFGLPVILVMITLTGWVLSWFSSFQNRLVQACVLGPIFGIGLFYWQSPFPEVRFVLPAFLLLFACTAIAIERICKNNMLAITAGGTILALSAITIFYAHLQTAMITFITPALIVALLGTAALSWVNRTAIAGLVFVTFCTIVFVYWTSYCSKYRGSLRGENADYVAEYPENAPLWTFVNSEIPRDATIAYSNTYLVYPLEVMSPQRRVVYAPVRANLKSMADLGWLGSHLSGEQLVPAAIRATIASPDRPIWLQNLGTSGAKYLVVCKGGSLGKIPVEVTFASQDPQHFSLLFSSDGGWIYSLRFDRAG